MLYILYIIIYIYTTIQKFGVSNIFWEKMLLFSTYYSLLFTI